MTVSEQIIQVIDALCEKFGIAINWTGENVIPYLEILCRKLITYEITTSICKLIIAILMIIGSIIAVKKFTPAFKEGLKSDKLNYGMGWELGLVFAIIGLIIINVLSVVLIISQSMQIIKCVTFPEMHIFEYVNALVNSAV